jgi:uncharacterized membrane protein
MLRIIFSGSGVEAVVLEWVEAAALGIELLAIAIIIVAIVTATATFVYHTIVDALRDTAFRQYKHRLGRALLVGLEILVAADIVRTVALEATLQSVTVLGFLVLIRTFLSWSLVVEMEGRWPWHEQQGAVNGTSEAKLR